MPKLRTQPFPPNKIVRADGSLMGYEIIGPFDAYRVVVGGRQVPYLDAHPANGGIVHLTLGNRLGLDIAVADAETVIPFIADCIAVVMGYTCHLAADEEPIRSVPFRRQHGVESVQVRTTMQGLSLSRLSS